MSDIDYTKILNYVMMMKSGLDLYSTDKGKAQFCMDKIHKMLKDKYLSDEELAFVIEKETEYDVIHRKGEALREVIDDIFKIMGIYKEASYIVE
jgi:hypothetical protein